MAVTLLLLAAQLAVAQTPSVLKPCVSRLASGAYDEPASLEELRRCHERQRQAYEERLYQRTGRRPTASQMETFEARQRAETLGFAARRSQKAANEDGAAVAQATVNSASNSDDARLAELKKKLWAQADDGKKGVTPELAAQVRDYLKGKPPSN